MMVTVIWEMWVRPDRLQQGVELVRRIWSDMTRFEGYLSHELLHDNDEAGHLVVSSRWTSRAVADRIRDEYAEAEPVRLLLPLLSRPRQRMVLTADEAR